MKPFLVVAAGIFFSAFIGLMVELGKEKTNPDTGCVSWTDFTHYGDGELEPSMDCKLHRLERAPERQSEIT